MTQRKNAWAALALAVALATRTGAQAPEEAWPPFLPPPETFAPDLVQAVARVWGEPTLRRTVRGRSARVPVEIYRLFVDTPEVTAAAARRHQLARYEVHVLDEDRYRADDHDGARGVYRVLLREALRRVMLSWGEHTSFFLGTIGGSAITVLDLEPRAEAVDQRLTAYVRIDNALAAALARLLVPIFGFLADRKLAEGVTVTARVAEWAVARPAEFCEWLRGEPVRPERREPFLQALPGCR